LHLPRRENIICGVVYRKHNSPQHFQEYFDETIGKLSASWKKNLFMAETTLNLLRFLSYKILCSLSAKL